MTKLKKILMERDNLKESEADQIIENATDRFYEYLDEGDISAAYDICLSEFGLEPDYIMDLF